MTDYKKKFGISELLTEYAYIQTTKGATGYYSALLDQITEYSEFLNEAKLTPELVEKLFKGFEYTDNKWHNSDLRINILFLDDGVFLQRYEGFSLVRYELKTLADLARLTAAKPIPLA